MANPKGFEEELKQLLSLKATAEDAEKLRLMGLSVKKPTKMTLIAAALYEKAQKGDLSAIKEILGRIDPEARDIGGVILIDDIGNKDK